MRRAYSLLEVLVAIAILGIALPGIFAIIIIGIRFASTAQKIDRANVSAAAAIQDLAIRDWLNPERWMWDNINEPPPTPLVIDPFGRANGAGFYVDAVCRITLVDVSPVEYTDHNGLILDMPEEGRPKLYDYDQDYTWLATISSMPAGAMADPGSPESEVTAAVCYKRLAEEERIVDAEVISAIEGAILLQVPPDFEVKQNRFFMLIEPSGRLDWIRTISENHEGFLDAEGPNLHSNIRQVKCVDFGNVIAIASRVQKDFEPFLYEMPNPE